MTITPVAFYPTAWMNGDQREQCTEVPHAPIDKAVIQYARIANGEARQLKFFNAGEQARCLAENNRAALLLLDNENCEGRLFEMGRLARGVAPGLKTTSYGFFGPWGGFASLDHVADHDGFKKHCDLNQDAFDYPDINSYVSVDSTKGPEDWDRSIDLSLHRMDRLIDLARQYCGKPLSAVIWPRMLFSNPLANIPSKWIKPYVQLAARCDIICVFDLQASDAEFIAGLKAMQRDSQRPTRPPFNP